MSMFGLRFWINLLLVGLMAAGLSGCSESLASQAAAPKTTLAALSKATAVGQTQLVSDSGLPAQAEYYNVKADLRTVTNRVAVELTTAKGWRQSKGSDMAVFTRADAKGQVKWQRVAIFPGKLDSTLK